MKTLLIAILSAFVFVGSSVAAPTGAFVNTSVSGLNVTVSGCGYPANSSVLVWVHSKQTYAEYDEDGNFIGKFSYHPVNFEPVATNSSGCFTYTFTSVHTGNFAVDVFYSPTGTNPYEKFVSRNFRI